MKIISWNINSLRLRLKSLADLVERSKADIICLQETKVRDEAFPITEIKEIGFPYVAFRGEKSYNGVAILSKIPFSAHSHSNWCNTQDCRHLAVNLPGDIELHNFYIPAGGDEIDPAINPKFRYKLDYLDQITAWIESHYKPSQKLILLGDLNVAPHENDVWSHKQLLKIVSHTPVETEKLLKLQKTLDFIDTGRYFTPLDQKLYSWWSYRNQDWQKSNRGRRLDHIWVTRPLANHLVDYTSFIDMRAESLPSDHIPIMIELNL